MKVSRADFELYNNGEELFGTRMLELILYPRNSIYDKGDYCYRGPHRNSGRFSGYD